MAHIIGLVQGKGGAGRSLTEGQNRMSSSTILLLFSTTVVLLVSSCGESQGPGSSVPPTTKEVSAQSVVESLKTTAEAGDAKAQFDLAKRFDTGDSVTKDQVKAFEWFLRSAETGNVEAMVAVAKRYEEGNGTRKDWQKAKPWWKKAADAGNAEGQYKQAGGLAFLTSEGTALWDIKGADIQKNAELLVDWLTKAAAQNHVRAKYDLGMTYLLGAKLFGGRDEKKLIPPDINKGLILIKEAADAGYWEGQWAMAVLYQSGYKSLKPEKGESEKYWKKFNEQTDPKIQREVAHKYAEWDRTRYVDGKNKFEGRALSFEETNKIAFEWFQKAADKSDEISIYRLGQMYRDGRGVWTDPHKAMELIKRAAGMGHFEAQRDLAFAYLEGKGVVKDYTEAYKWLLKAADEDVTSKFSDVHKTRNALGALHEFGWGVDKDSVLAYAWYNIAAGGDYDKAKQNLNRVEKALKPEELREAQALSREWNPGKVMARVSTQHGSTSGVASTSSKGLRLASVGTGFYISQNGNILTNHHVIDGCTEIRVPAENAVAKSVVSDQSNDLALAKLEVTGKPAVTFPDSDDLRQGEEVFVFGFPLDGYLPSAGNITPGIVSALAGPGNNSSLVQITAPVQPGNSGGPLFNKKGKVIGVVVGKADAIKIAKVTGDIPQNINFAIASRTVKSFLDGNRIEYQKKGDTFSFAKETVAIADDARKSSIKIECWR